MNRKHHKHLDGSETGASFSDCGLYRYTLWRVWDVGNRFVNFVMLNPSTADEMDNDPTVERCQRRATLLGFTGLIVTNLFAFRSTDPLAMKAAADPVGPQNDDAIRESVSQSNMVICAWGRDGKHRNRAQAVVSMLRDYCPHKLYALRLSADGTPWHPLYLPYSLKPFMWPAS